MHKSSSWHVQLGQYSRAVLRTMMIAGILNVCAGSLTLGAQSAIMTPHRLPTDTGRMVWGHQDYTRYTTADPCDRAIENVTAEVWRTVFWDTLVYAPATDTLPTAAVAVANACGTRFSAESPAGDLWSVMRIALARADDGQAARVVEKQLALAGTESAKATVLMRAIWTYMSRHPPRLAAAMALLPRLSAFGKPARRQQVTAHLNLLSYWSVLAVTDSIRVHANAAMDLLQSMSNAGEKFDGIYALHPYLILSHLESQMENLTAARAVLERGVSDIGTWRDGGGEKRLLEELNFLGAEMSVHGKQTQPLQGEYWFNTNGTQHPAPGVVSLLAYIDPLCGAVCAPYYVTLQRLHARYGKALDITLLTHTRGFAPGTGPVPPAEEAKTRAQYYLDSLKIPGALLIETSPVTKQPDGKLKYEPGSLQKMFGGWKGKNMVLVDKTGKVRWLGSIGVERSYQREIEGLIDRVMAAP